jgi:ribulose-5-phosphate 4-epimerase/fuculose-1-phosphate aldolase
MCSLAVNEPFDVPSKRGRVSDAEWQARVDLAAAYRLSAHFGWTHLVNNHISLRVPGTDDQFLINPYNYLWEQITASSLIKIDVEGNRLDDSPNEVNKAGFVIHSAIHMGRKDLHCVMHTHTVAGMAVSALDCGLLPLNQGVMRWYNRIAYHDFEGIARNEDERVTLVRDLAAHKCMILRNHGLLTAGVTVAEAFYFHYHLEKACQTQMMVLASNQKYSVPPPEVCEHAAKQFYGNGKRVFGERDWPALIKLADRLDPSYRT